MITIFLLSISKLSFDKFLNVRIRKKRKKFNIITRLVKNERKETLIESFYCKELILVKKEILKYKNKGEINEVF